jgi:hypothetical protein
MILAIVHAQARSLEARQVGDQAIQLLGGRASSDARAMHAHIQIQNHRHGLSGGDHGLGQLAGALGMIDQHGVLGYRIFFHQQRQTLAIGTDHGIGQQDVRRLALAQHFRLGNGGAFEARDAGLQLHAHHLRTLDGFHMRAQTLRTARQGQHCPDIVLDALRIKEQTGTEDGGRITQQVGCRH